jgi:hypothetical protein
MFRSSVVFILTGTVNIAFAADCSEIEDSSDRLACYDAGLACMQIASNQERLECFDGIFGGKSEKIASGEVPPPAASESSGESSSEIARREAEVSARETELAAREAEIAAREAEVAQQGASDKSRSKDEFGKRWRDGDEPMDFIEATIVELKSNPFKVDYLRLDNGQVWREISDSRVRFKVGEKVIITEGVLGSFDLQTDSSSQFIKVKRLK